LQQLEAGLRAPAASQMLSYGALKLFPFWDPLRGDPRFEKIVDALAPKSSMQPVHHAVALAKAGRFVSAERETLISRIVTNRTTTLGLIRVDS
jgi:hypothetical protein